jgi:hypothetical protein
MSALYVRKARRYELEYYELEYNVATETSQQLITRWARMKQILQLALHKLRHPSHHICFDRRFCGRCGYLEKQEYSVVMQLTGFLPRQDSSDNDRKIA